MTPSLPAATGMSQNGAYPEPVDRAHFVTIDAMRGIAALAVCWFHLTQIKIFTLPKIVELSGRYGWLGVEMFFVISGFIIPYSLMRSGYHVSSFFRFIAKRSVRLDPPYLATIAIVLVYKCVTSRTYLHQGEPFVINWKQLLAHLAYINAFVGYPWLQTSFWTLAIEFQYYIFSGLFFGFIARSDIWSSLGLYAFFVACVFLPKNAALLPTYLPIFLFGIVVFRFRCLGTTLTEFIAGLVLAYTLSVLADGGPSAVTGLGSCLAILLISYTNPILSFLGDISYSLYLTHELVISTVVFQGLKLLVRPGQWFQLCLLGAALAAAILFAYVLHRLIELPAKTAASRIRYGLPTLGRNAEFREAGAAS